MRLNSSDHQKVAAAIREAEARTDGEVSAIVAPSSDSYADVVLHWSLLIALLPLAIASAWPGLLVKGASLFHGAWEQPPLWIMLTLLITMTIFVFLIARFVVGFPSVRMALTPAGTKDRRVLRRSIILFRAGTEQRTLSKTGVLLYLSLAEHRAEIVADAAIHSRASHEQWGEAMAVLIEALRDGRPGDGMAAAIGKIGDVLATHFPHTGEDPNEMPDRLIEL